MPYQAGMLAHVASAALTHAKLTRTCRMMLLPRVNVTALWRPRCS